MPAMNKVGETGQNAPGFHEEFRARLRDLFLWRRDVRRFRRAPLPAGTVADLLALAALAPSVGYSQPWRFVRVADSTRRAAIRDNFARCNAEALERHRGEKAEIYARLKLEGLDKAPVQLAVFCDEGTQAGHGLGRGTMPETLRYSVVMAVHTLWLAARARGIGVGWVSILDPQAVVRCLDVPEDWSLVAYLCLGWPEEEHLDPELARHGWEDRQEAANTLIER